MTEHVVKFENVSKRYPGQVALDNESFELPSGKVIGLIGPNGSGKSTILKLISGLIHPNEGTVIVNNKNVTRRISSEVAYLSELDEFYSFYTVEETIKFYENVYHDFDINKAIQMVDFMKLDKNKKLKHLSKGNRGRVKIILALSRKAPLILMDEPLSGLDPMARELIIKSLISFIDLGRQTVIMTTHEVSEIEPLLDVAVAIKDGQVFKIDEVDHIRSENNQSLVEWMKETYKKQETGDRS